MFMKKPSTGFSCGRRTFGTCVKKTYVPISLVCRWCTVLVSFLNVVRSPSDIIPPCGFDSPKKVVTHVCRNFSGLLLCVRAVVHGKKWFFCFPSKKWFFFFTQKKRKNSIVHGTHNKLLSSAF